MVLTFRQIGTLWERYWDRKMWELSHSGGGLGALFGSGVGASSATSELGQSSDTKHTIDATSDAGVQEMLAKGLPVKFIPAQQG